MRLIYVVSLSHPTLLYHKDHTYMKGSAWFETFAAIFMFLHISITNCLQNYRKKTKQQNFQRKSFEKSYVRGHNRKKESYLRNMINSNKREDARMKFRKKYTSDRELTNTRTYKSFFQKKVSKSHFSVQNKTYIFNTQHFTTNETSLKIKGEVSSKYHKLARSIMISCLHRKKMLYEVIIIAFLRQ